MEKSCGVLVLQGFEESYLVSFKGTFSMNSDGSIELPQMGHCGGVGDGDEGPSAHSDGDGDGGGDDDESMDCCEALVLMKFRVLLVENDDSTRYAIGALLRTCGYQVMSTHDSEALVLKCLSKGATDFLVKPIRKNEFKFLRQHIWGNPG